MASDDAHAPRRDEGAGDGVGADDDQVGGDDGPVLVDWSAAGRRLVRSSAALFALGIVGWVVVSLVTGQARTGVLGNFMGLALLGIFLVELWVVGGSALRGMLRAGDEGERLAGGDVGILPPQLQRGASLTPAMVEELERRRRDGTVGADGSVGADEADDHPSG